MSRLDELPPDQRAALSLLLRQHKRYGEVALLLGIAERAVHDRAHAALAVLAPREARELSPERRDEIGEYLLGQARVPERLRARAYLAGSEQGRAWAQAIRDELTPLAGSELPEIPPPSAPATSAPTSPAPAEPVPAAAAATSAVQPQVSASPPPAADAPPPSPPAAGSSAPASSRLGGALLLGALVVGVVVAVILLTSGGGSHHKTAAGATSTTKSGPTVSPAIPLSSPTPSSKTAGAVVVLSEKGKRAFYLEAQHLPATSGFFYAIWLYNSPTSAVALSRAPAVTSTHRLSGGAPLPTNAGEFREILLTRETNSHPTQPGHIVLRGAFTLGG